METSSQPFFREGDNNCHLDLSFSNFKVAQKWVYLDLKNGKSNIKIQLFLHHLFKENSNCLKIKTQI